MKKLLFGSRFSVLRLASLFTTVAAMSFASVPLTYAVVPAPDGGYDGRNTAEGTDALFSRTTGAYNTAVGFEAMKANTTGVTNTAIGYRALRDNLDGGDNTAVGNHALQHTTGSDNIAVGSNAGINITTGSDNIDVGNLGSATDTKTIRIGRNGVQDHTFIAGISNVALAGGASVVVRTDGQLGVAAISSARFKEQIKPMNKASEAIFSLKPVTFLYKKDIDPQSMPQFGLVAEEVAKVNPDLVTRDDKGELYTVRYDAVNAMLLNEFLKEHCKVEQLEATAGQQAKEINELKASLKEQAAQIQKVSAQLEMSKPAPQVVVNK
jgi:endosialidase-like protein